METFEKIHRELFFLRNHLKLLLCFFHVLVLTTSRGQGHWTNSTSSEEAWLFSLFHGLKIPNSNFPRWSRFFGGWEGGRRIYSNWCIRRFFHLLSLWRPLWCILRAKMYFSALK